MAIILANNATATLASDAPSTATTLSVLTGLGAVFPVLGSGDYFYATLASSAGVYEIVKVVARSGDVFTVVRGQAGTVAVTFPAGSRLELRVTKENVEDLVDQEVAAAVAAAVGVSVQAYSAELTTLATTLLTYDLLSIEGVPQQGEILFYDGALYQHLGVGSAGQVLASQGAAANPTWYTIPTYLLASSNLADLTNVATARSSLGLGSIAVLSADDFPVTTPDALGHATTGDPGIDDNVILGGYGTWPSGAPTLPTFNAVTDVSLTVSSVDLELTGHFVDPAVNNAVILGGRASYYSYVAGDAAISITWGADCYNDHLAGINLSPHSQLIKDDLGVGSHGITVGGSIKIIGGEYSGSFAGQIHELYALQSVILGGRNIRIGNKSDQSLVRRSLVGAGYRLDLNSGYESVMLGGELNVLDGDSSAIIASDNTTVNVGDRGVALGANQSSVTADQSMVLASTYAVADHSNTIVRAAGRKTATGDSQCYDIIARRTSVGTSVFPSRDGGSTEHLFTPAADSRGVGKFIVSVQQDTDATENGAEYEIVFSWSNIDGSLTILGQSLTTIYEDNVAFNCTAITAGTGTKLALQVTTPDAETYACTAHGHIIQQIF